MDFSLALHLFALNFLSTYHLEQSSSQMTPFLCCEEQWFFRFSAGFSGSLFIVLGLALGSLLVSVWWVKLCLLGFAMLVTLRTVVFFSVSSVNSRKTACCRPASALALHSSFAVFWAFQNVAPIDFVPFIVISPFIAVALPSSSLDIWTVWDKKLMGCHHYTFQSIHAQLGRRAKRALRKFFEELGEDEDVEVSFLNLTPPNPKPPSSFPWFILVRSRTLEAAFCPPC